jgi:hypothetical protein
MDELTYSVYISSAVNVPSTRKFWGNKKLALEKVVPVTKFN